MQIREGVTLPHMSVPHIYTPLRTSLSAHWSREGAWTLIYARYACMLLSAALCTLTTLCANAAIIISFPVHFVWTLGMLENLLHALFDCVSVCISAPTITGAGSVLCLEDLCKWRQALATQSRPHARPRYAHHAHRAACCALRRSVARRRSPACRRRHHMPPTHTVVRTRALTDFCLPHANGGAHTRALLPMSSHRRPPTWWSTQMG